MGAQTTGLGSQLGASSETTYGTGVTVAKFFEYGQEAMNLSRAFVISQQLRAGRMYPSASRRTPTTRAAAGTFGLEVPNQGLGLFLNMLHGETVTPSKEAATNVYKQVHNIGTTDPYKKSATVQIGKPQTSGTVEPFTYAGTIATAIAFSIQAGGLLEMTVTADSQNEVTETVLATASYPSGLESFRHTKTKVKVAGVELPTAKSVSLTLNGPRDTSRFYLGAELKAVPLTNAYNGAAASVTVDYNTNSLYEKFAKGETPSLEIIFQGEEVEAKTQELKFVCAAAGLDGDTPNVPGPGIVQQTIPFVILDNGTNPPVVATYVSKDSAIG